MKDSDPSLSSTAIRAWVGPASFSKGEAYYFQNAIFEPRRQGLTLTARCRGSSAPAYRVQVVLDANASASAFCSCPLTWSHAARSVCRTQPGSAGGLTLPGGSDHPMILN